MPLAVSTHNLISHGPLNQDSHESTELTSPAVVTLENLVLVFDKPEHDVTLEILGILRRHASPSANQLDQVLDRCVVFDEKLTSLSRVPNGRHGHRPRCR
jgi:hypothetical protein